MGASGKRIPGESLVWQCGFFRLMMQGKGWPPFPCDPIPRRRSGKLFEVRDFGEEVDLEVVQADQWARGVEVEAGPGLVFAAVLGAEGDDAVGDGARGFDAGGCVREVER